MASNPPDNQGFSMIWWGVRHPPANPTVSFAGKTVLITGANTGLGFEAALKFASLGASRLLLAVRSLKRGEEARSRICQQTGCSAENVKLYDLDMSTFASVKSFANNISKKQDVDIAILNAGIAAPSWNLSPEGYEMSLQVNVLSTALLGILLLPQLKRSAGLAGNSTHLEIVGSIAGRGVNINEFSNEIGILEQANQASFFTAQKQYGVSKLFEFYVMQGLVEALSPSDPDKCATDVIINAVCPGLCRSTLGRDFPALMKAPMALFHSVFARSAEQGARSYVSGVLQGEEAHGQLWSGDMFFK
ncbi:hypothetical protein N7478_000287 [Penicillium angulare]|uniref:uncharacterized protein n=1 Tax=Penicillium angulare TaxID=116970 RepID=UPI002541C719|nr:uncharacterized protein N7478_000287 [Penicillium angulare]KAJ5291036.1 hypothetical protein N7478_000287 [Penicillium angulare]